MNQFAKRIKLYVIQFKKLYKTCLTIRNIKVKICFPSKKVQARNSVVSIHQQLSGEILNMMSYRR